MPQTHWGKILDVDLSSGKISTETLDAALCRDFIGGYGVAARLLYDRMKPGTDPMSPANILGFFTGPLTGTPALQGSRYVVVAKSPLTDSWGDANSGGSFGPVLRFAGYDGIMITGASEKPVCLTIVDGKAEIIDASWLWGKDTTETEDLITERWGQDAECACIGPAGEKLSRISCVMNNKGRAAGRSGLGAVMGSKKLKAIVVKGSGKVSMADEARAKELREKYMAQPGPAFKPMHEVGTIISLGYSVMSGDSPVKNWGGAFPTDFPQGKDKFTIPNIMRYKTKGYGCWRCTIACGGHMEVKEGPYAGTKTHKPEYETACAFGTLVLNDDVPSLIKINDMVNRAGVDSISAGGTVAFAIECYQNGLISKADTGGLELKWGDHASIVQLLDRIAKREGIGDILADGVKRASQKIGKGSEAFAVHIQGEELPMHDPRFYPDLATTYKMDATPARHTQGSEFLHPMGLDLPKKNRLEYSGRGEHYKKYVFLTHVVNAAGECIFGYSTYPIQHVPDFLTAVTGWEYSLNDCFKIGERIADMRHAFNLREGVNPLQVKVPGRVQGIPPLAAGNNKGVTVDIDTMVKEFCHEMDWDAKTAKPSQARLKELGLEFLAKDMS